MKKVLVIGGQAVSLIHLRGPFLKAMVARGHRVFAAAGGHDHEKVRACLSNWGVEYETLPMRRAGFHPAADGLAFHRLLRLMRRIAPDVVLNYATKPVLYGSLAAARARVPAVYSLFTGLGYAFLPHTPPVQRLLQASAGVLFRAALASNRAVFFQNPDDRAVFIERGLTPPAKAVLVNGSGVDLHMFPVSPAPTTPVFLLIANLLRSKGIAEYAEAARRVRAQAPDVRCLLAGGFEDGPTRLSKEEVNRWIAEGTLEYLGRLDDVRPALSRCSVFVLPSLREGTPHTVLQAMATGRAIITTDVPGCRETVRPGVNGLLVPPQNAGALTQAMLTFVREPARATRMGAESRHIAEKKYDVRKINQVMLRAMEL